MTDEIEKIKDAVDLLSEEVKKTESSPEPSQKCDLVLKTPLSKERCYDFRGVRQYVMCSAWDYMDKHPGTRFADAISQGWDKAKKGCAEVSAVI